MPETTRRREGELLRALFEVLRQSPEGIPAREALERLASRVQLTEYERGSFPSGGRRFEKIVRFASINPVKAGWMMKSRGSWALTESGKTAFTQFKDAEQFAREASRLYRDWLSSQPEDADSLEPVSGAGPVQTGAARDAPAIYEEADEQAWAEIERHLGQMPPYDFQAFVAGLLRSMGYFVPHVAPPGKDGGVDMVAFRDALGVQAPRLKVQVKRHQQSVSVEGVRAFLSTLSENDVGIFVNFGGFTRDAEDLARNQERRQITLVDLDRLVGLWIDNYGRLDDDARRLMPLRPVHFLAPVE